MIEKIIVYEINVLFDADVFSPTNFHPNQEEDIEKEHNLFFSLRNELLFQ